MIDRSEYYNETSMLSFTISYGIRDGRAVNKVISTDITYQNYYHHKLPISMNPLKYGILIRKQENVYTMQINDTNVAIIMQHESFNEVEIYKKGILTYKYKDIFVDDNSFIRDFGNKKFHFFNNEIRLLTVEKPIKFISALKKTRKFK